MDDLWRGVHFCKAHNTVNPVRGCMYIGCDSAAEVCFFANQCFNQCLLCDKRCPFFFEAFPCLLKLNQSFPFCRAKVFAFNTLAEWRGVPETNAKLFNSVLQNI